MFGKAVYGLAPYAVLALFVTVLTSSSSMGIAISLAYYFVELILVQIMSGLFDWFGNISDYLLGPNISRVDDRTRRGDDRRQFRPGRH